MTASKEAWLQFLRRAMPEPGSQGLHGLHGLLKYWPDLKHQDEVDVKAYCRQSQSIFLPGIPDVKASSLNGIDGLPVPVQWAAVRKPGIQKGLAMQTHVEPALSAQSRPSYDAVVALTDQFCQAQLNHE